MKKYPRTPHLEGSRLQPGDQDLGQVAFDEIKGKCVVIEEKVDGANCGISFDAEGDLRLQSRGHYLQGGPREMQFTLFKQWAHQIRDGFYQCLGQRYVLFGEWLYAKHTIFYDRLPHYFLEFDIFDRQNQIFLSSKSHEKMLGDLPIHSVPVLHRGTINDLSEVTERIGPSKFMGPSALATLKDVARKAGQSTEEVLRETDTSGLMEGLYIKVEDDTRVVDRMKFVRPDFLAVVDQSGSHWHDRPILKNQLAGHD